MTSVTRQSLRCKTKGCPFTPDEHEEWMALCRQAPEHGHRDDQLSHQHFPKKGMGGHNSKSKIEAILCWPMHDRIDNGDWGNAVKIIPGRGPVYFAWDLHGKTLIERALPSLKEESDGLGVDGSGDSADAASGEVAEPRQASAPDKSPPAGGSIALDGSQHRPVSHSGSLTHEQRVAKAQEIKDMEWNRQWIAGDTGNAWIAELGEEAEQYLSDFGYVHESLANILRVCAAIPPPYRNGNLRYSHHVVVYKLPREDQVLRLTECEVEGWSVAEFRRQVDGEPKPRIKRWPMEELLAGVEEWPHPTDRPRPKGAVRAYLKWLEGQ